MPLVDRALQQLQGSRYFSVFDALSGYWQVPLTKRACAVQKSVSEVRKFLGTSTTFGSTISEIMEERECNGRIEYRVRWRGYMAKDDTWLVREAILKRVYLDDGALRRRRSECRLRRRRRRKQRRTLR